MALATTCPHCKTSFRLVPDQLKLRRGLVRCGVCRQVFSGVDTLRYIEDPTRVPAPEGADQPTAPPVAAPLPGASRGEDAAEAPVLGAAPSSAPASDAASPDAASPDTISPSDASAPDPSAADAAPPNASPFEATLPNTASHGTAPAGAARLETPPTGTPLPETTPEALPAEASIDDPSAPDASPIDASSPESASLEAPLLEPSSLEAPPLEAPPLEAPPLDAPPLDAPPFDAAPAPAAPPSPKAPPAQPPAAGETAALFRSGRSNPPPAAMPDVAEADEADAVDFFGDRRRIRGFTSRGAAFAALGVIILGVVLALQLLLGGRHWLAARFPPLEPALTLLAAPFGLRVEAPVDNGALTIESFEMQPGGAEALFVLNALVRNKASHVVRWPALELSLLDAEDRIVVRRVLLPAEYLGQASETLRTGVRARAEVPLRTAVEVRGVTPTGYRVRLVAP